MIGPGGHPVDPGSRSGDFGTHQARFGSVVLYPSPHSLERFPLLRETTLKRLAELGMELRPSSSKKRESDTP